MAIIAELRGTEAVIDLDAIRHNVHFFGQHVGEEVAVMAVVKANAYGHGAVPVARAALQAGATWLGVACAEEAGELRESGIHAPILILGASNGEQARLAVELNIDLTVFDEYGWEAILKAGSLYNKRPRVHLKVDTGMGRLGVFPDTLLSTWVPRLLDPRVIWQGLMSHLAESDAREPDFTREQLSVFLDVIETLRTHASLPPIIHLANSAAALRFPGTHGNLVRIGIGLYGVAPFEGAKGLKPAMRLGSRVTFVKRLASGRPLGYGRTYHTSAATTIAGVGIGYADGYRRALSNRAHVMVGNRPCPVVGRISMDQMTIAVPDDLSVRVGDEVTLFGPELSVNQVADWADTIGYEILTGISPRVNRRYLGV